jgi:1,4-alpha-glucan branching enzyme
MVTIQDDVVEFRFYRPNATQACVAGDFNHWRTGELVMEPDENGYWTARLQLPAGEFKFRYLADGVWYTDYAAFGLEMGRHGFDSVVRVPQPQLKVCHARGENAIRVTSAA